MILYYGCDKLLRPLYSLHKGVTFSMAKQVMSWQCYTKEVSFKGTEEMVELHITELMMKDDMLKNQWRHCIEIRLKLVEKDKKDIKRELSAEGIVERWELLRDCWLQLAAAEGLLAEAGSRYLRGGSC